MRILPLRILIGILFITVPYTALLGINDEIPELRTWRLIGALLIFVTVWACKWKLSPAAKRVILALSVFDVYVCIQPMFFQRNPEQNDILFIGSIIVVTSLMLVAMLMAEN